MSAASADVCSDACFTRDTDLLIRREDLEGVRAATRARGFVLEVGPIPFDAGGPREREIYRVSKVEPGELLSIDLLLVNAFLQPVWDEREVYEWEGRQVQIVSADGLARMKRLAGRDQDLVDLKHLGYPADAKDGGDEPVD